MKWIVRKDKSIDNIGCTHKTEMCMPGAYYDKTRHLRIDMPTCCLFKILRQLDIISKGFTELKIKFFITAGLLIGYARNQTIIPYDEDGDIFVAKEDWRSQRMMKFVDNICKEYGFITSWRTDDYQAFSLDWSKTNLNGLGFWSYWPVSEDVLTFRGSGTRKWGRDVIEPPRQIIFNGIQTYAPNNVEAFLDVKYGVGRWQNEYSCEKKYGRKCMP